jgi:DNA topoisomerase-3
VFEHGMAYVCEKSVGPEKTCDFRSGKVILQQPVEPEQMQKLLATGRTDLLKDFVSSRTRRKFSAFLVRGTDGKVGFEFEKREPKAKAPAKRREVKRKGRGKEGNQPEEKGVLKSPALELQTKEGRQSNFGGPSLVSRETFVTAALLLQQAVEHSDASR